MKTVNKKLKDYVIINPKEVISPNKFAKKVAMEKLQPFCRDIVEYELCEYKGGTKFRNGDTIMARITPCLENGKTAKVNFLDNGEVGFGSTEYIVFRAKEEIMDADFLYYLIISPLVRETAIKSMVGSSGRQRVQTDVVANIEIEIPSLLEQKKVANIMKVLDDKIALNQKINKNLEEQAQEIFNKYFIDVPDIPDGWSEGSLTDIADYLNGLAMQKFPPMNNADSLPVLKIKELRQGMCDSDSDRCSVEIKPDYIIQDGDVIFSWSGSLLVDFWCGGDCGLNQHLFKVSSAKYDKWFYYSWTIYHLQEFVRMAADRATTMGHIKRDALEKARVLIPCHDDYVKIGNLLQPLYNLIITNRIENRRLANLRDALLPRLMSGEIDVSGIEV